MFEPARLKDGRRWPSRVPCASASANEACAQLLVAVRLLKVRALTVSQVAEGFQGGDTGKLASMMARVFREASKFEHVTLGVRRTIDYHQTRGRIAYLSASKHDKELMLDLRPCLVMRRIPSDGVS